MLLLNDSQSPPPQEKSLAQPQYRNLHKSVVNLPGSKRKAADRIDVTGGEGSALKNHPHHLRSSVECSAANTPDKLIVAQETKRPLHLNSTQDIASSTFSSKSLLSNPRDVRTRIFMRLKLKMAHRYGNTANTA